MIYTPFDLFARLYEEAQIYDNMDLFIAERGWQEWMNEYADEEIAAILKTAYKLSRMTFAELKEFSGLSMPKLAGKLGVSSSTLEKWVFEKVTPSPHEKKFIAYVLFGDELNRK